MRVEPRLARQDLVAHELGGGLPEQPLLFGEILAREDVRRADVAHQELTAGDSLLG